MRTLLCGLVCTVTLLGQDTRNLEVVGKIKAEAFDRSEVMDTLSYISDVYGPRLTASPEFNQAAQWTMDRLKSYGLANVHEEAWGPFGRAWTIESYTLDMTAPRYSHLVAAPLAWSAPTHGVVSGEVILALGPPRGYDLKKLDAGIDEFEAKWKGKLNGKIILFSKPRISPERDKPNFRRLTDAELADLAKAPAPAKKERIDWDHFEFPDDPKDQQRLFSSISEADFDIFWDRLQALRGKLSKFLSDEGVVMVLTTDNRAHDGMNFAEAAGSEKSSATPAPPTFVIDEEQYTRMTRILEKKIPVTVSGELKVKSPNADEFGQDIIAEIPGTTKANEVVMVGAHFDSWHTGTGATDNGAGSAVMIEVMRVLKALNLPMTRTVRIGLWSGEEEGLYGSSAYVKSHFGDPITMQLKPEHATFDAYLNLDNGSGKIRGVYLQGNDGARPIFQKILSPYADMGASTISLHDTGGTDHLSFDAVGLPGFQFIQDPLDYMTVAHHSNMDTFSHAVPEDLMQAAAIVATAVYEIANQEEKFPRKPLPLVDQKQKETKAAGGGH
jgi:carboxypeptidase Q